MYVFNNSVSELSNWARKEVEFKRDVLSGMRGKEVKRVQEWLNLQGVGVVIDSAYGPATTRSVVRFQDESGLSETGEVDDATFNALVKPMRDVLKQRLNASISTQSALLEYARAHLAVHPVEVGGQNCGPWVRLYMKGNEGRTMPWCAGFVTFLLKQATQSLQIDMPIKGSGSCDSLATQANEAGLFLPESEADSVGVVPGSIFLVRRTSTDWTHTGRTRAL
ncbi:Peptidoglycan-binding domain 1 protein [Psychromonas ingrahamii 37]|uniref:Peptidoglycan-binding domain 1 protein n=1 Tax=Psychromonas ingrahamii (strain DSM 17664 / CCUG 51855 / 37) TaxID=357804 RepID=A1SX36_PSYIN|nr:peptidoglycan-binding domain-containing protein [Psychromonas ingrahamii]ABM04051.1 Peptidoglycan-binding domain 1 protein [Psychromonas ingrahamii 37]